MRKKLKISAIIIMMIILCFAMCGKVKAATSSVDLKASVLQSQEIVLQSYYLLKVIMELVL